MDGERAARERQTAHTIQVVVRHYTELARATQGDDPVTEWALAEQATPRRVGLLARMWRWYWETV